MRTDVEKYLNLKHINYRLDGDNAIAECPVCKQGEKWGIHIHSGQWQCFRGSCTAKGNLKSLKKLFGDKDELPETKSSDSSSNWDDEVVSPGQKGKKQEPIPDIEAAHKALMENDEVLNWLNDERGFSLDAIKECRLGLGKRKFSDGRPVPALMFPYFRKGKCIGVKYRSLPPEPKDFRFTSGYDVGLYREDTIYKDMPGLIIVEGEADAICLLTHGIMNVVAVSGANAKNADWAPLLDLPKKIYLIMDNDQVGIDAAKAFATRFGIDKFNIVNIPQEEMDQPVVDKHGTRTTTKDVNDWFLLGHTIEEFRQLLEAAHPFDIEGVTTMNQAFENIIRRFNETGSLSPRYEFKWPSLTKRAKGYNPGDLVVVLAAPKTGKTTLLLNQMEFMAATYESNIHFDCMEMSPDSLVMKWSAMMLETNSEVLEQDISKIKEAHKIERSRKNGFLFTRSHPKSVDDYLHNIIRFKARYDTDVLVIDNWQFLIGLTIGKNGNRPAFMSETSKKLKSVADEIKVPVFLVSQPKGLMDGQMVSVHDSEGSTTLMNDADLFLTLNRNPEVKMKLGQAQSVGNLETMQSHSDTMWVETGLSRNSPGGFCTLKIDGAKSLIREYNSDEIKATTKQGMINGITFVDDNERAEI